MKKIIHILFAAVLVFAATFSASAQTEQNRSVSGFNSIGSAGPFNVHVKIDGTESLKISASSEVIDKIETIVKDGHLEIKFKHHNDEWNEGDHNYGEINIYVHAKSLSALANAGSGSMKVDGTLSGEHVNISLSGSGDISATAKGGDLHANIAGSGFY